MSKIKKHQCPSCGGNLSVDNDKQMYRCAFCGSTYDYEYFREEKMHELGETYLSRGEFMAAADAYKFTLKKNPHDFLALRGLLLAAAHVKDMDDLLQGDSEKGFTYDSKLVKEAIENASEEDKEYVETLGRIFSDKKKVSDNAKEIKSLKKEKEKIYTDIKHNDLLREDYYIEGKYEEKYPPKPHFVTLWTVTGIFLGTFIIGIISLIVEAVSGGDSKGFILAMVIFSAIVCIAASGYNYGVVYPKIRMMDRIDSTNAELYRQTGRIDEKIKNIENESDKLLGNIRQDIYEFTKMDRLKWIENGYD